MTHQHGPKEALRTGMTPSLSDNHIKIAIRCWARDRARQLTEKALTISPREMETFLAELLTDALLTFNETYSSAINEQIHLLERRLEELYARMSPQAVILPRKPEGQS